jgi:hypothetical protein
MGFLQETHGDKKIHLPPGAVIAVAVIYNLSGITNIILFLLTRRGLLLFDKDIEDTRQKVRSTDSIAGKRDKPSRDDVDSIEGRRDKWQDYMGTYVS